MHLQPEGRHGRLLAAVLVAALAGCASSGRKAPVEERNVALKPPAPAATPASAPEGAPLPLPGAENAGKPGYYTVKPGDTLLRVALEHGQNWRDLVRWNNLENPNLLEVGQVLRVVPPVAETSAAAARAVPGAGRVDTRPLEPRPAASAVAPAASAAAHVAVAPAAAPAAPAPAATDSSVAGREGGEEIAWTWPAAGAVIAGFDEGRNKGLTITGKAGDPVVAAGDGRVVYAGSSLRGYGNLVIVKHSELYLTAYAHNQVLLVKDDQIVRRGQKIAEMGSTDAERVQLHFEIRRQGKPVDPAKLLPSR
jgi:lipoprotein NlpD